jgi:hypothetical protein
VRVANEWFAVFSSYTKCTLKQNAARPRLGE